MTERIFIVEDNLDTFGLYARSLRREIPGLELDNADTVSSAIRKLDSMLFDIIIVDLKIPGSKQNMGGFEVIDHAIAQDRLRPIVVITGYGTKEYATRALTQGVLAFIEKSDTAVEDLVSAIKKIIASRQERILRSGNPFTARSGEEPTVFGGRDKELAFFEGLMDRVMTTQFRDHFLVLGDWGIGKSSLLAEYKRMCQTRGQIACVVPLSPILEGTSLLDAVCGIVEGILRGLPFTLERFAKLKKLFASFGITVLGTGVQFARDTSQSKLSPQAFLHDTLVSLWEDLQDTTSLLTILLDDLEYLFPVSEIVVTIMQTLKMSRVKESKILFGLATTPGNWRQLTSVEKHHPLSRFFISRVELASLTPDEITQTVHKTLGATGVSFSPDIISLVHEYTGGHPFEMQVLCHNLYKNHLSGRVTSAVWEKALQGAINDIGTAIFDNWFQQASAEEAKILHILAEQTSPATVKKINELAESQGGISSLKSVPKYLQRLVAKGLVSKRSRGTYLIPDSMFRAYVCTRPQEE